MLKRSSNDNPRFLQITKKFNFLHPSFCIIEFFSKFVFQV